MRRASYPGNLFAPMQRLRASRKPRAKPFICMAGRIPKIPGKQRPQHLGTAVLPSFRESRMRSSRIRSGRRRSVSGAWARWANAMPC